MRSTPRSVQQARQTVFQSGSTSPTVISPRSELAADAALIEPPPRPPTPTPPPNALKAGLLFLVSYEIIFTLLSLIYLVVESPEIAVLSRLDFGAFGFFAHILTLVGYDVFRSLTDSTMVLAPSSTLYTLTFIVGLLTGCILTFWLIVRAWHRRNRARIALLLLIGLNCFYILDALVLLRHNLQNHPWIENLPYEIFSPHYFLALSASPLFTIVLIFFLVCSSVNRWYVPGSDALQGRRHKVPPRDDVHASRSVLRTTQLQSQVKPLREEAYYNIVPSRLSMEAKAVRLRALKAEIDAQALRPVGDTIDASAPLRHEGRDEKVGT